MRMYTGEALPKEQIAVIKGTSKEYFFRGRVGVYIISVDEELRKGPSFNRVEVMPGLHKVVVGVNVVSGWGNIDVLGNYSLEFNAEAGHEYKIITRDHWKEDAFIALIDTNSDTVVSKKRINKWHWFK